MTMEVLTRDLLVSTIGMAVLGRLWVHKSMGQGLMITLDGQFLSTIQEIKSLWVYHTKMKFLQMQAKQEFMNFLMVTGYSLVII